MSGNFIKTVKYQKRSCEYCGSEVKVKIIKYTCDKSKCGITDTDEPAIFCDGCVAKASIIQDLGCGYCFEE